MFKGENASSFAICFLISLVLLIFGIVMLGFGFKLATGPIFVAFILFGYSQKIIGRNQGKEENLGKWVSTKDLSSGKYVIAKSIDGNVFIGDVYPDGSIGSMTKSLHNVRVFDHRTAGIEIVRQVKDMPIGAALLVRKENDELHPDVGMMA